MKFHFNFILLGCLISFVQAGLLHFRPLSAQQVYRALRAAKREDAIPQGRVITQGIAALSGLAAGIATGIGVPLVFNIDLANVTGITAWLNGNRGSDSSSSSVQLQTQEICFNSRAASEIADDDDGRSERSLRRPTSLRRDSMRSHSHTRLRVKRASSKEYAFDDENKAEEEVGDNDENVENTQMLLTTPERDLPVNDSNENDDEDDEDNDDDNNENANKNGGRHYETPGTSTAQAQKVDVDAERQLVNEVSRPTSEMNAITNIGASPTTAQTTAATSPDNGNTQINTITGTMADNGSGTGTYLQTTTDTGNRGGNAVNCVVIQKPANY